MQNKLLTRINERELFYLVLVLVLVFLMAARAPYDTDLYWHLRAGETMLETGRPLLTDVFSYTRAGAAWINHSWLSEVILALLYRGAGFPAIAALMTLLAAGSMGLVFLQMEGPGIFRAFLIVFGSLVAAPVWTPRPQSFSLILFALLGFWLFQYRQGKFSKLWLLPILFCVWANLHGGYALGFILIAFFLAGEVLDHLLGATDDSVLSWRCLGKLATWTGISVFAILLTPNGFNAWLIPFQTVDVKALQQVIQEWGSPDFHEITEAPFLWLLLVLIGSISLSKKRLRGSDLLILLGFTYLGLMARRNFGPFALAALPILSRTMWGVYLRLSGKDITEDANVTIQSRRFPKRMRSLNLIVIGLLATIGGVKFAITANLPADCTLGDPGPNEAVTILKKLKPSGHLFNEYDWGGYLTWCLPQYPVFVDGRTDLFGDQVIGEWMNAVQAGKDWNKTMNDWKIQMALLYPSRPLVRELMSQGWSVLWEDDRSVLLQRP